MRDGLPMKLALIVPRGPVRTMACSAMLSVAMLWAALPLHSQTSTPGKTTAYHIQLTLDPAQHSLAAKAAITFMPRQSGTSVAFRLNPALRVDAVQDAEGNALRTTRGTPDDQTLNVTPPAPVAAGTPVTWTFTYKGAFGPAAASATASDNSGKAESAVPLASIGNPVSYLLRDSHWFPSVPGDQPFTAAIQVRVPDGEIVLGSGPAGPPHADGNGWTTFSFNWPHPGFPGTILAGKFRETDVPGTSSTGTPAKVRLYWIEEQSGNRKSPSFDVAAYAKRAGKVYHYLLSQFGSPPSGRLDIVELPDGTVPVASSPGIVAIAASQMAPEDAFRLLTNAIAHQWWGEAVRPQTPDDAWITNGMCRLAEIGYLEHAAGREALVNALVNVSASALAYKTPLRDAGRVAANSAEFQSLTYDKGAMVLRMLEWQIGAPAFQKVIHEILATTNGSISSARLEQLAEAASGKNLSPFFNQWLNETGAPALKNDWILYRLDNNRGYKIVGEVHEDLDLFQMTVDIEVRTKEKTIQHRVQVAGPRTQYTIHTSAVPENVSLDPGRRLLRSGPRVEARMHVLRGRRKGAEGNFTEAVSEYQEALTINPISSLANFHLGQAYVHLGRNQAAESAFRAALNGDGDPKWTEAWSELELGKLFDAAGQRQRAVNEYRKVLEAGDNTQGAATEARAYLQQAYRPAKKTSK